MNRKFGIELEWASKSYDASASKLSEAGFSFRNRGGYCHSHNNPSWELKTDSSAGCPEAGKPAGCELSSKVYAGVEGLRELKADVEKLDAVRSANPDLFHVCKNDGFHVHVDISDLSVQQVRGVVQMVIMYEPAMLYFQPDSRRDNRFCKPVAPTSTYRLFANGGLRVNRFRREAQMLDRYYGLNLTNWLTRGTIEFRYAAGTLNPETVVAWTTLLLSIVEKAKATDRVRYPYRDAEGARTAEELVSRKNRALRNLNWLGKTTGAEDICKAAKKNLNKRFEKFAGEFVARTVAVA